MGGKRMGIDVGWGEGGPSIRRRVQKVGWNGQKGQRGEGVG